MKAARREGGAAAATCRLENSRLPHGKRKNKRFPAAVDVDRGPLVALEVLCGYLIFEFAFWYWFLVNLVVVVVVVVS